jgi:hypothetical protein
MRVAKRRALLVAAAAAAIGLGGERAASAQSAQAPPSTPAAASPAPTPTPTATPYASATIGGDFLLYGLQTYNVNVAGAEDTPTGADPQGRADVSDMLVNASVTSGYYKLSATAGGYAFPVVGQALNPTFNSFESLTGNAPGSCRNTSCFTLLPLVQATYTSPDSHWTVEAGKLGTMIGAEGAFTYQNVNVQRGIGWALEPVVSRGVHVGYTNGQWTFAVEGNDGWYSGWGHITPEYEVAWAPSSTTSITFVGMNPNANAPGNATAAFGNTSEYNLVYAHTTGKWTFTPYALWLHSPASASLTALYGKNWGAESAYAISLLGSYAFTPSLSLGFRVEDAADTSSSSDASYNADFIGYGPGSGVTTYTLTPTFKFGGYGMLRLEWSHASARNVAVSCVTPGDCFGPAFGPTGALAAQNRIGVEFGAMR